MQGDDSERLQHVVELLHSCRATLVQSVRVRETFRGKLAWDGIVHIFAIERNRHATLSGGVAQVPAVFSQRAPPSCGCNLARLYRGSG